MDQRGRRQLGISHFKVPLFGQETPLNDSFWQQGFVKEIFDLELVSGFLWWPNPSACESPLKGKGCGPWCFASKHPRCISKFTYDCNKDKTVRGHFFVWKKNFTQNFAQTFGVFFSLIFWSFFSGKQRRVFLCHQSSFAMAPHGDRAYTYTYPETNSNKPLKNRPFAPKGNVIFHVLFFRGVCSFCRNVCIRVKS